MMNTFDGVPSLEEALEANGVPLMPGRYERWFGDFFDCCTVEDGALYFHARSRCVRPLEYFLRRVHAALEMCGMPYGKPERVVLRGRVAFKIADMREGWQQ